MTIVTIHRYNDTHLEEVMTDAQAIGSVTVNVYYNGEVAYCLEGVHRVEAAKRLGLPLILVCRDWEEVISTDCGDAEGFDDGTASVSSIYEYAYDRGVEGQVYTERDFLNVEWR